MVDSARQVEFPREALVLLSISHISTDGFFHPPFSTDLKTQNLTAKFNTNEIGIKFGRGTVSGVKSNGI